MNRCVLRLALALLIPGSSAASAQVSSDPRLSPPGTESPPLSGTTPRPLPDTTSILREAPPPPQPAFSATPPASFPSPAPAPESLETIIAPTPDSPRWIVSAEALWLERTVSSSIPLGFTAFSDAWYGPSGLPIDGLYSDDVLFPLQAGVRFQVGARIGDQKAIQVTYWGLQHWSLESAIYGDPDGESLLAHSRWLQTPALIGGLDNSLGYTYTSGVDNCEINQRLRLDCYGPFAGTNWLWGVRYFRLSDHFTLSGSDLATGVFEDLEYLTSNNLVGFQAGIQWIHGWDRFELTTECKIGLLANFYTQRAIDSAGGPAGSPPGFQAFDVTRSGTGLSALFEVSLLAHYRVSEHLWLRGGYQLYCVTGLALAPRQLAGFGHNGTVGLDGLSLGLEASW